LGARRNLVGVLTTPDPRALRGGAPAFLVPNVGVHHRVGPFRVYVDLARRLAGAGFPVLRFDLSGLGDSELRSDAGDERARAVADLREAMAFLERRGHARFAVLGFCSGTDPAHVLARDDARIDAAVFLDGYAYRTRWFHLHEVPRWVRPSTWGAAARRRVERLLGREAEVFTRDYPTREACERDLVQVADRGAALLLLFTGGARMTFNHAGQLWEMFPRLHGRSNVQEAFHAEADHLFSTLASRRRLLDEVVGWAQRAFPADAGRAVAGELEP
jgi:hypothetical protein